MVKMASWSEAIDQIFRDPFRDQLQEQCNGDLAKEVEQIHSYLRENDYTHLRDDRDATTLANFLGIPLEEIISISNKSHQIHHIAKIFVARMDKSVKAAAVSDQNNHSVGDRLPTMTTSLNNVYAHARPKVCDAVNATAALEPNIQGKVSLFIHPKLGFQSTEVFRDLKSRILSKRFKVIHMHGMSGCGKSEIARAVCKEIVSDFSVCYVQCQQNGAVIVKQWQKFLENLALELPDKISAEVKLTICRDLEINSKKFVQKLEELGCNFLLVVEDVASCDEKARMRDLINELLSSEVKNIVLLIVTQKADVLNLYGDLQNDDSYEFIKVRGFTENEAVSFLKEKSNDQPMTVELALELAYSPFRLYLARAYCLKYKVSFKSYYQSLGKDDIIRHEKRMLEEHSDLGKHTYEVIMKILMPRSEHDIDDCQQFEVIKMMSFLADAEISDILLGVLFRQMTAFDSEEQEQRCVKYLMQRLEEDCDMSIRYHLGKEDEYGLQRALIHNDILRAVRSSMDDAEKSKVILQVVGAIIGLIGKENRVRVTNILLLDTMNHIISVTEYAKKYLAADVKSNQPNEEKMKLLTYLSRLHEVIGFSATQATGEARDRDFGQAVDYLWSIASVDPGASFASWCFAKHPSTLRNLLCYEVGKDARVTAETAYKRLRDASGRIPIEIVKSNCSRFFPITLDLLKSMRTKVPDEALSEMERHLKEKGMLTSDQIELLQQNGALLKPDVLQKIYLPECIASILHTRGRQVLYSKKNVSSYDQKRYEWYTDVGLKLCEKISSDIKVQTIFEYIIQANNKLPRMLHVLSEAKTDHDFLPLLKEICSMCKALKDVKGDFYEHGVYKAVSGTPFTVMNALKYLVKANTKVYKRRHLLEEYAMPEARVQCEELYSLAKENAEKFAAASNCMIHVGKYYAAVGEYDKALVAFDDGFSYKGHGIKYQLMKNTNIYSWALYNYGRALWASCGKIEGVATRVQRFVDRYHVLQIPPQWREELEEMCLRVSAIRK